MITVYVGHRVTPVEEGWAWQTKPLEIGVSDNTITGGAADTQHEARDMARAKAEQIRKAVEEVLPALEKAIQEAIQ